MSMASIQEDKSSVQRTKDDRVCGEDLEVWVEFLETLVLLSDKQESEMYIEEVELISCGSDAIRKQKDVPL